MTLYGKQQDFSRTKRPKKADLGNFLTTKQQKKQQQTENAIQAETKKATQSGLKLFHDTLKFPYKLKNILYKFNSSVRRADYVTTTKST